MPPITNDWADYLKEEYKKPYYRKLKIPPARL